MTKQLSLVSNATVNGIHMSDIKSPPVGIQLDKMVLDLLWNNCPRVDPAWYQIWDYPGGHYSISEVFSLLWRDPTDRYQHRGNVGRTVDLLKYETDTLAIFPFSYIIWQKPSTTLYTQDETVTLILSMWRSETRTVLVYVDGKLVPSSSFKPVGRVKRNQDIIPYSIDLHFTKGIHTFMVQRNAKYAWLRPAIFTLDMKLPRVIQPFVYLTPLYIRYYSYPTGVYSHALLHQPASSQSSDKWV